MRRRHLIGRIAVWSTVASAVLAQTAHSQQSLPVIGFLNAGDAKAYERPLAAFLQGLSESGFDDGRNVRIEYRWAGGSKERLTEMAADLVQRKVTVIAATTAPAALAAKAATATVPIVFETGDDPALGLVTNLSRPGGNVTGAASLVAETAAKELELLHEVLPAVTAVGALIDNSIYEAATQTAPLQTAARGLGLRLHVLTASNNADLEARFSELAQLHVGALVIRAGFRGRFQQIADLAIRNRVPTISNQCDYVLAGGLLSYSGELLDGYRLAGSQVGRVLKGDKPANLPVVQTTKVHLCVNLNAAKALGLSIPPSMLGRADEVIE